MFSIILGVILYIVSMSLAFYTGRHFAIIKRDKLQNSDVTDIFEDIKADLKREDKQPIARIISPSKKKAQSLKELEDMSI